MSINFDTTIGGARANSYVTIAEADQFFENHPHSVEWGACSDEDKQRSLIKATMDVDRNRFHGHKWHQNQALDFPRIKRRSPIEAYHTGRMSLQHRQEIVIAYPQSVAGGLDSVVVSELLETNEITHFPADFFEGGEVQVISGTGVDDVRRISASSPRTGTLTFVSAFSALDTTSKLLIFGPLPMELRYAVCEQALFRMTEDGKKVTDFINQGLTSLRVGKVTETYGDRRGHVLCREAIEHLSSLITRIGRIT